MKPTKGLFMDSRPGEQPEGTNPFGKNGIQYDLTGSLFNEPGFRKMAAVAPYRINGIIETDTKPIILSTDNTNSAIGYFNPETELYEAVYDDRTWAITDGKLGFNTEHYIRGQAQRNYKGEIICNFTDKVTYPKYANMDRPELVKSIDDFRLFATFSQPDLSIVMGNGGIVPGGAYYVAIGYERNDGTSTPYSKVSNVTIITPGVIGGTADKTLEITITNADQDYDLIRLAIISKVNGVTSAVELTDYIPVSSGTIEFTYTGEQLSTDIDISQILTHPALYDRVGTIGQLNDYSYLGVLHSEPDLDDMQQYALMTQVEWVSELQNAVAPAQDLLYGRKRGFMHGEVYAVYIRYRKARGGMTKWFITRGVGPTADDLALSTEVSDPVPRYKVEDRIPYYDPLNFTGGCGPWQNNTETYPDTIDFDATSIGGENLRGKVVNHYKMPSLLFTKNNLYPTDGSFGVTNLDLLGVRAINVRIPAKYNGIIDGYEIGYAIRTVGNRTIQGQSSVLEGAINNYGRGQATQTVPIYTTGGNFTTNIWHNDSLDDKDELQDLKPDTFRMHPFDVLFFKPAITPTYLQGLWKMRRNNLGADDSFIENSSLSGAPANTYDTAPMEYIIDYTTGEKVIANQTGNLYKKIIKSFYTTANLNVETFINYKAETAYSGYLEDAGWNVAYSNIGLDTNSIDPKNVLQFEEAYFANLLTIKDNLYENFYSQQLASMGEPLALGDNSTLWGGDTFVCAYTFHTYGRYNSIDSYGGITQGVKIARRIVCESTSNIALRFDVPGNQYSLAWPKAPLIKDEITNYLTLFDRSQDPNQFGYTKDYNAINDLIDSTTWNPFTEYIYDFPYRIHRGGKASRQGRPRSWRTFLPLDYYEIQKNMGLLVNLEGMDDKLIIHTENAMFLTQDKAKLEIGSMSVTLGSGDIFQFEPQEAISSKLGYAGTQHDLACVRTPFGYVFVDAKQGEMYIYKGKLSMLNPGINTFLRDALKVDGKNPYTGNGITIGWDQKYKRILLTVKNVVLTTGEPKIFADTDEFWNNLAIGDIVSYQGRLIEYLGVNNTSFDCPADPVVHTTTWEPIDPYCLKATQLNEVLSVVRSGSEDAINSTVGNNGQPMPWSALTGADFSMDVFGHITYNGSAAINATLEWQLTGDRFSDDAGQFKVQILKQGSPLIEITQPSFNQHINWGWSASTDTVINPGDIFTLNFIRVFGTNQVVTLNDSSPGFSVFKISAIQPTANASFQGFNNRRRVTDGSPDGYTEPNDHVGLGVYFPPVLNLTDCPITGPVITWIGTDGICLKISDSPSCGIGFTYDPTINKCVKTETVAATPPTGGPGTAGVAAAISDIQWNDGGARLFLPGFPVNGSGTVDTFLTTPHFWVNGNFPFDISSRNTTDGRMNHGGLWVAGNITPPVYNPVGEYIGFARKITVATAKVVYIGMSADNDFKFVLNGVTIVDTASASGNILGSANFNYFNIYPVTLQPGDNFIEMYAKNNGLVAGFAAEIYDISRAILLAAGVEGDLNIIFSTKDMVGQNFDLGITEGYSCPVGYSLDTSAGFNCVRITQADPTLGPGATNSGIIHYDTRCRKINNVTDGYCEPNTSTGLGPLLPDVPDSSCTQTVLVNGDTILVGTVFTVVCNDSGCTGIPDTGVHLEFATPTPFKMTLLVAVRYLYSGITPVVVGYSILPGATPPVGDLASPQYVSPELPFTIDIPVGTTVLDLAGGIYQEGKSDPASAWKCNNCQRPITDIYLNIDPTSVPDPSDNTYQSDFTVTNAGITTHNLT